MLLLLRRNNNLNYIDIHCHLDHPRFTNVDSIIQNAKKAGIGIILTNGINPETNRKALEFAKKYNIVKAALGIYPIHQLRKEITEGNYPLKENVFDVDEEIAFIEKHKAHIAAIGEVGLDGLDTEHLQEQKVVFEKILELGKKINKPVIVHSRRAEHEVIDMLETSSIKKVLLHCFSGKRRLVQRAADLGYSFSIPTNIVRAENFQLMAERVNINQLFCETDAPYLSPFKDKINEPSYVIESYKKIAQIKGMELQEVINNIWVNYSRLFS